MKSVRAVAVPLWRHPVGIMAIRMAAAWLYFLVVKVARLPEDKDRSMRRRRALPGWTWKAGQSRLGDAPQGALVDPGLAEGLDAAVNGQ